jgi:hypothetical protein
MSLVPAPGYPFPNHREDPATTDPLRAYSFAHVTAPRHLTDEEIRASIGQAVDQLMVTVASWGVMQSGAMTDLSLAAAELADNALRHAGTCTVRVSWAPGDRVARLEVADTSPRMPTMKKRDGGLRLVTALAVRWGCEKDPTATGKVVFADIHAEQWLSGDARLKALVRRHPERASGEVIESDVAVAATLAAAEQREALSA